MSLEKAFLCQSCTGTGKIVRHSKLGKPFESRCVKCKGTGSLPLEPVRNRLQIMINNLVLMSPIFFNKAIADLKQCKKLLEDPRDVSAA